MAFVNIAIVVQLSEIALWSTKCLTALSYVKLDKRQTRNSLAPKYRILLIFFPSSAFPINLFRLCLLAIGLCYKSPKHPYICILSPQGRRFPISISRVPGSCRRTATFRRLQRSDCISRLNRHFGHPLYLTRSPQHFIEGKSDKQRRS